jgi:hypothetical protein
MLNKVLTSWPKHILRRVQCVEEKTSLLVTNREQLIAGQSSIIKFNQIFSDLSGGLF